MEEAEIKEIRNLFSELTEKHFRGFVRAAGVFGSSVKRKKSANDIDILFLVDDTQEDFAEKLTRLINVVNIISKHSKLNIHVQNPVSLSLLWSLIIKGEPWIITAIRDCVVIYDPHNYINLLKKLIRNKSDVNRDIKSERLVSRAEDSLTDNRSLKVGFIEELFFACMESVQAYLLLKNKTVYKPRKAIKELANFGLNTDVFFEIMNLNEKANKGALSEFSGEDLDYYKNKVHNFILKLRVLSLEELKKED